MTEYLSLWPSRGPLVAPPQRAKPVAQVKAEIAARYRLRVSDLEGQTRVRKVAYARQEAYALAYGQGRLSLRSVGQRFGNRDHATVRHGILAALRRNGYAAPEPAPAAMRAGRQDIELRVLCRALAQQEAA